jgi:hypothetical protein
MDIAPVCASSTLKDFGLNPKNLGAEIGMTMVLHTNSRKLDYHPRGFDGSGTMGFFIATQRNCCSLCN